MADNSRIQLAYGQKLVEIEIPCLNLQGVYYPDQLSVTKDEDNIIAGALANPIASPRLHHILRKGDRVAIVTSDISRPCPSQRLLPFIVEELGAAGIPDRDVIIVIALGLHRPMTEQEIDLALSPELRQRFVVLNHDLQDVVRLGITSFGTPVEVFRPVVEADKRICLGNIEFHYYAGFSGGAKAIVPGLASRATVLSNHALMVRPGAETGRIDGNPVRMDLEEAVAMLGVDFILNVLVDGDHRIVGAVAGEVNAAHRAGCEIVLDRGTVTIPRLADIVIASAGGYPRDINLYQSHKALRTAKYFVREGGIIILVAECIEGIGHRVFEEWLFNNSSPDAIIERLQRQFVFGGHIAASIASIQKQAQIYLVSSIPDNIVRQGGMLPFNNPQGALKEAFARLAADSQVIVLPQAGSLLPRFEGSD